MRVSLIKENKIKHVLLPDSISGNYCTSPTRICLKDYVSVVSGQEYIVNISNTNLHISNKSI